jgi:ribonucleotide monophosphatase NagD (HAD superfamily)
LQGKRLVFVTNNSTKSRAGYLGKFTGLGLKVNAVRQQQQQQQQQQ